MDGWLDGCAQRPVMEKDLLFSLFFIFFLMVTTFGLLNNVVGVIVEVQHTHRDTQRDAPLMQVNVCRTH